MGEKLTHNPTSLSVIAIGSRLGGDDAIGLELIERLQGDNLEGFELLNWEDIDAMTLTHNLLQIETPVLFIDCAEMRLLPGEWSLFNLSGANLKGAHHAVSSHGLGLSEALSLARILGFKHKINLFTVQPFDLNPASQLSSEMQARLPLLLKELRQTIDSLIS